MFSAVLDDVSVLRDSIATIAELLDETELRVTEQGIELIAADRAVVVVLDFFLSKNVFSEYHFEQEERIGMNLVNFFQVLRRANASDQVHIQLDGKKLNVTFATKTDSVTPLLRSFVLPLIDISKEETPPLGQLRFPAKITMNADLLASGIDDAELIADSVILTVRKDKFVLRSESDTSSTQLDIESGTDGLKIHDIGEPVRARYSLDYLKKMIKGRKLSNTASIEMGTDYPMKMEFSVPEKIRLGFILAPRIED